jgi:hypothetical protein
MGTIWIVTSGDYDDCCIMAVFSNRELAMAYLTSRGDGEVDSPHIMEWDVDRPEFLAGRPITEYTCCVRTVDGHITGESSRERWTGEHRTGWAQQISGHIEGVSYDSAAEARQLADSAWRLVAETTPRPPVP